jgi:hypothetical protein
MRQMIILSVLALVLAACGTNSDGEVATLEDAATTVPPSSEDQGDGDAEEALLAFAQCMRDNGVPEFPDPQLDQSGNLRIFGDGGGPGQLGADQGTLQAAFEECGSLIEGLIQNNFRNFDQSEFQDNFLEFATCMRDQGIEMPDPDFSGGFGPGTGGRGGLFGDINPQDPAFQEAAEECQGIFEGGFGPGGGGFGGGNG